MNSQEIKNLLKTNGVKQLNIASSLGVSHVAVSLVVRNRAVSSRIRQAIAEAVNKPISDLWPEQEQV